MLLKVTCVQERQCCLSFNLSDINIVSFNLNGIKAETKRCTIFNLLKAQNVHIVPLQETHSLNENERVWSNEWGYRIYFSHGTNMSKGVAILMQKDFPVEVEYIVMDTNGRIIIECSFIARAMNSLF